MASRPRIQPFDASDPASCRALVAAAAVDGLDVVCNVSGVLKWGPSLEFSIEDFQRILQSTPPAFPAICQAALPHLIEEKGNVVNTASTAALRIAYTVAYAASKHAVAGLTNLAVEFATRRRATAICPGRPRQRADGQCRAAAGRCRLGTE